MTSIFDEQSSHSVVRIPGQLLEDTYTKSQYLHITKIYPMAGCYQHLHVGLIDQDYSAISTQLHTCLTYLLKQ